MVEKRRSFDPLAMIGVVCGSHYRPCRNEYFIRAYLYMDWNTRLLSHQP